MEITKVKMSKLFTIPGKFENISFGYEAEVGENDNATDVKKTISKRIDDDYLDICIQRNIKNDLLKEEHYLKSQIAELKTQKITLQNDAKIYEEKFQKIKKFMAAKFDIYHIFDDVPF